jgi:uncharacterized protein YfaS (alpha-2-macroglobulin family)
MLRSSLRFLIALLLPVLMLGCGQRSSDTSTPPVKNTALWAQYLSEHSAGLVSRNDQLRLHFSTDVIAHEQIGKPLPGLLSSTPAIELSAVFNNPRELVLVPSAPLQSGQRYHLSLHGAKLPALPAVLGDYQFFVDVIPQGLEVRIDSIQPVPGQAQQLLLKGLASTADSADTDAVEKTVTALLGESALALQWRHSGDGRRHNFQTPPLTRAEQATALRLRWDGKPIGAEAEGEHKVDIPARDAFSVTRMGFDAQSPQQLVVNFTDALDAKQNLAGLVAISSGEFSSRIEGSNLLLFPKSPSGGDVEVSLSDRIRSADGRRLGQTYKQTLRFELTPPGVRFAGKGSILPATDTLSIPFEAINVAAVQITAFRVYDSNLGQFLQVNPLGGERELKRVGRYLWRKSIPLGNGPLNQWRRLAFDVSELYRKEPGALYRFTLSIDRGDSLYACSEAERAVPVAAASLPGNDDDYTETDSSGWDFAESYYGVESGAAIRWEDRENPCKDGFYRYNALSRSSRNFIAANIGLIAKVDDDNRWHLASTDLRQGLPLADTQLKFYNYQNQEIARARSDAQGLTSIVTDSRPFYLAAENGAQRGYLKLSESLALPVSHFDVGGVKVERGIKGTLYGERGVWRPGDQMYLTFVLQDPQDAIPEEHPATLELINPRGQTVLSQVNANPVGDFYHFAVRTRDDDLTGSWRARVLLGGQSFERTLRVETVMPNRLKIELETGEQLKKSDRAELRLFSQWLHGASAGGLKADVAVRLKPRATQFTRNADFSFDDPTRQYRGDEQKLWEGKLDAEGRARIDADIVADQTASGFLNAEFTTRVFEPSGAFSIAGQSVSYHPYRHYVGLKLPKGDLSRNMLLTDTAHTVEIASLDADGKPVALPEVEVSLYKVQWRWWWEQGDDGLADFAGSSAHNLLSQATVPTHDGRGSWQFEVKFPDWGRYLVRACDRDGGHCAAKVVYIDWPGWAGRAGEDAGPGANVLSLASDKPQYQVGEVASIQLPPASQGRALLSVENGSGVLSQQWLQLDGKRERFELPITASMAPNVFVSVILLQPHQDKHNDRPIRLYGIVPLLVVDPATHLQLRLQVADEVRPQSDLRIQVSEQQGRAMTYTVAVVDEGLLGLTRFKTPQLHEEFYRREALGVKTWDMFDEVVGAYGGALERLLALGGSDNALVEDADNNRKRFPPVVRFIGPFELAANARAEHVIALPAYVGAVRTMLVAGEKGAYGSAEKSVRVRQPLMLQATLPRVLGPGEELRVPVSVFVLDDSIREVELSLQTESALSVVGTDSATLGFERASDKLGFFTLKVGEQLGMTRLRFIARAGKESAEHSIDIEVRAHNAPSSVLQHKVIKAGEQWRAQIQPHGLPGTNSATLEVSRVPPLNLGDRLHYLVQYPHGCVEQTTSTAFPQVFLHTLMKLEPSEQQRVQGHVAAGIARLRQFQQSGGGFGYWPGDGDWNSWSTSYVGHFLLEAKAQGFRVPSDMLAAWQAFQKSRAQVWLTASDDAALDQAYRLYTLALAGAPELGAMNRLREQAALPNVARWLLAAAYQKAGLADVAAALGRSADMTVGGYEREGATFGSALRDRAILLESLVGIGHQFHAKDLAQDIATALSGPGWHSTHSVSWSLLALSHFVGEGATQPFAFDYGFKGEDWQSQRSEMPVVQLPLAITDGARQLLLRNPGEEPLYVNVVSRGVPASGAETAAQESLALSVAFSDLDGEPIDPDKVRQGQDFRATVTIENTSARELQNLALTQIVPAGWEIIDTRVAATGQAISESAFDYRDVRDDRVHTYFGLASGETRSYVLQFNAAYPGHYYLPGWSVEAMYDASRFARQRGRWIDVDMQR